MSEQHRLDEAEETALLIRSRSDPEAFGPLYRSVWPVLVQRLARHTLCSETAADLASETMARAAVLSHRFDPDRGVARGWLWGIAKQELRHWQRRGAVRERSRARLGVDLDASADIADDVIDEVAWTQWRDSLTSALATLDPQSRVVMLRRAVDGDSYAAIAADLGCSEAVVRKRFSRAIASLRISMSGAEPDARWA